MRKFARRDRKKLSITAADLKKGKQIKINDLKELLLYLQWEVEDGTGPHAKHLAPIDSDLYLGRGAGGTATGGGDEGGDEEECGGSAKRPPVAVTDELGRDHAGADVYVELANGNFARVPHASSLVGRKEKKGASHARSPVKAPRVERERERGA